MTDSRIVAIVQARINSQRLPGKVLRPVAGKPMICYLLERLQRAKGLDGIAVATSDQPGDDPLAAAAAERGVECHRGSLHDVAGRLLHAAEAMGADALVRISGDSPLMDPAIVDRAVALFRAKVPDLVTNVLVRTFPKGQSVEIIDTRVLRRAWEMFAEAADFEHVTPYFYRQADRYRIVSFESQNHLGSMQLSVDTEEDFRRFEAIVSHFERPQWSYGLDAVLALLNEPVQGQAGAA